LGKVEDLVPLYDRARVFVAPSRFAGGIPLKVYEAAAHGVPVVASTLIAQQLGWRHDVELLVADTPEEFAAHCLRLHDDPALWQRLRDAALHATRRDCGIPSFADSLARILDSTLIQANVTSKAA
jgi:glycosyltransferase involved in cell wall biosynthesis